MKIVYNRTAPLFTLLVTLLFLTGTSCKKDEKTTGPVKDPYPVPVNLKYLGQTYASGAAVLAKVYAEKDLFAGYNKIYVALYDSITGARITNSHIFFEPVMTMGSSTHGAPVENPAENATSGLFQGAVIFTMASGTGMTWSLGLQVHNHLNNLEGEGELDVDVISPADARIKVKTALNDNSKIVLSLIGPSSPVVGINDFILAVHKLNTVTNEYDTVSDYTVQIEPLMPSMGHGSPNNVNPVYTGNGHYSGKVNFTMSGLWQVNLLIKQGTAVVDSTSSFNITP